MTELKRHYRVGILRLKKEPLSMFLLWVLATHIGFVLGFATIAILAS